MVYRMEFKIDGACRGNGNWDAIGAAAAVLLGRDGEWRKCWTRFLEADEYQPVTNQRAELTAVIVALEAALRKVRSLNSSPYVVVEIQSDSRYVVKCMNEWVYKWSSNGWINSKGNEVANRDLIQEASDLDDELKEHGDVDYVWIPRSENYDADRFCNEELDENS
ncbi:hypothetical protein HYFRA_00001475 [Hymenoscyphus fraxineus]|uniref:ribonuclease H n=1 Tax=Hymenoscyphus fraxineus TaxID=746836 RepID=A0A9N9PY51_9HELO|nr:hypothetical protein HYFRA_00001475 [Hymenoscyphus fraxineus]